MRISKELLKGSTSMLILKLLEKEAMYGYQMIKELGERSEKVFDMKEGTLYPILHTLEAKGWITSYWQEVNHKNRKYYSISEDGRKALTEKKEEWNLFSKSINKVLRREAFANE